MAVSGSWTAIHSLDFFLCLVNVLRLGCILLVKLLLVALLTHVLMDGTEVNPRKCFGITGTLNQ